MWAKKPWRWNPVQGGDYKGKPAKVIESQETKTALHVKSIPVNWAGGQELTDCRMETAEEMRERFGEIQAKKVAVKP